MSTLDVTSELTVSHPDDPEVTLTLRWTDRAGHAPGSLTADAMRDLLRRLTAPRDRRRFTASG